MARAFLGLGSNLGDRLINLRAAVRSLSTPEMRVRRFSSVYESDPVGPVADQPAFLNLVVELDTELEPRALLERLQRVETELGRERTVPEGPRLIDLDLLLVDQRVSAWPELVLPHPELGRRAFVLLPLLELRPELRDPRSGHALAERLEGVSGQGVRKLAEPLLPAEKKVGSTA